MDYDLIHNFIDTVTVTAYKPPISPIAPGTKLPLAGGALYAFRSGQAGKQNANTGI
jgi:hypothetical protein